MRPASQAVQALSKQPTQQRHRSFPQTEKRAMDVKSVKFAVLFLQLWFLEAAALGKVSTANLANSL